MENLFDQPAEDPKMKVVLTQLEPETELPDDDCPMSILKMAKELCDYYEAPGMNCLVFESKLMRLQMKVDKEILERNPTGGK